MANSTDVVESGMLWHLIEKYGQFLCATYEQAGIKAKKPYTKSGRTGFCLIGHHGGFVRDSKQNIGMASRPGPAPTGKVFTGQFWQMTQEVNFEEMLCPVAFIIHAHAKVAAADQLKEVYTFGLGAVLAHDEGVAPLRWPGHNDGVRG